MRSESLNSPVLSLVRVSDKEEISDCKESIEDEISLSESPRTEARVVSDFASATVFLYLSMAETNPSVPFSISTEPLSINCAAIDRSPVCIWSIKSLAFGKSAYASLRRDALSSISSIEESIP